MTRDDMNSVNVRIDALERRLRDAEDRLALLQIIASYGPAVDSGTSEAAARIWTGEGVYDTYPIVLTGHDELAGMVTGELHQSLINGGAAHLQGVPFITIDGDCATVTHYSQLVLRDEQADGFRIWRTGVNQWSFVRTEAGWRAVKRVNRQLDGTDEGRELLAKALDSAAPAG